MLFLQLFLTFMKIGIFTFGGGYAMIALIRNEVVVTHEWMTSQEFTDLLAISQMTPGPIGINTATFAGYTAVMNAGYSEAGAIAGAVLASLAVILLPVGLMIAVMFFLRKMMQNERTEKIMGVLRLAVVGLIASAALIMFSPENFGSIGLNRQFVVSLVIFIGVFIAQTRYKAHPILLIILSGITGLICYSI